MFNTRDSVFLLVFYWLVVRNGRYVLLALGMGMIVSGLFIPFFAAFTLLLVAVGTAMTVLSGTLLVFIPTSTH